MTTIPLSHWLTFIGAGMVTGLIVRGAWLLFDMAQMWVLYAVCIGCSAIALLLYGEGSGE